MIQPYIPMSQHCLHHVSQMMCPSFPTLYSSLPIFLLQGSLGSVHPKNIPPDFFTYFLAFFIFECYEWFGETHSWMHSWRCILIIHLTVPGQLPLDKERGFSSRILHLYALIYLLMLLSFPVHLVQCRMYHLATPKVATISLIGLICLFNPTVQLFLSLLKTGELCKSGCYGWMISAIIYFQLRLKVCISIVVVYKDTITKNYITVQILMACSS